MVVGSPTKLNLIPSGVMPVVYINQGDAGYDKEFLVYNGDSPYNVPAGVSATIRGKKADGYGVTEAAALTTGSNLVTVTVTEQMVAAEGANLYELVFVDTDGLRIATINMIWAVKADALGDSVISDSDIAYAEYVMLKLQSVAAYKAQLDTNTAAIASETAARNTADATLQNNINSEAAARASAALTLQNNINAEVAARTSADAGLQSQINQLVAPTGSAPSAAEVQNARIGADGGTYSTLGDAIRANDNETKTALNVTLERIMNFSIIDTWIIGKFINTSGDTANISSPTTNADYMYALLNCSANDLFYITGTGGGGPRLWAFLNDAGTVLSKANSSVIGRNLQIKAPTGATKLVINTTIEGKGVCYKGYFYTADAFLKNRIIVPSQNGYINVDVANSTLTIPKNTVILSGDYVYENTSANDVVDLTTTSSGAKLVILDKASNAFSCIAFSVLSSKNKDSFIVVCAIRKAASGRVDVSIDAPYAVNGRPFNMNVDMQRIIVPSANGYININTTDNTLEIPADTIFKDSTFLLDLPAPVTVDLTATASTAKLVILNKTNNTFGAYSYISDLPADGDYMYVCSVRYVSGMYLMDIGVPYTVDGNLFGVSTPDNGVLMYEGEKIDFNRHPYSYEFFMKTQYDGTAYTQNDIAIYGNYLVTILNPNLLRVYNKTTKTLLYEYPVAVGHGNSAQFSAEFADPSDLMPLLYTGYDGVIKAVRVTASGATVQKEIRYQEAGYYSTPIFDFANSVFYIIGYTQPTEHNPDGTNGTVIVKFSLENMTPESGYYVPTEISRMYIGYLGVIQGGDFLNGTIYMAFANTSAPFDPKIQLIDVLTGSVITKITEFPVGLQSELEGLTITTENGAYVIYVSEYRNIYKLEM